ASNITSFTDATTNTSHNNLTTSYGSIFFHNAVNLTIKLMSLSDSSATTTGCAEFSATCTLITPGNNVVNITNTSDSSSINLGMFYDSSQEDRIALINVSRYNITASGWESRSRTNISSSEQSIRLDGINSFPFITHGVVNYSSISPTLVVNLISPNSSVTLCGGDFSSCQLNMTCQYNCTGGGTCSDINIFAEFRNNSVDLFKNISGSALDQLRLNGSETNPHSVSNLASGSTANTSFIIRSNLAGSNNTIRCGGDSSNAGQSIGELWVNISVNAFIDTSINISDIPFGNVNPTTENNPSLSNPANLINTQNSNTLIDIYTNATNLTSGSNRIAFLNLSIATGNTPTASTPLNESGYLNGTGANQGYIENMTINSSVQLFWFLDVETGQTAGIYNGSSVIHSVEDGVAP
ncbi:MAG TPA: hypothetical protein VJH24_02090, partial [Candidatus Bilamarchaeaceae archaeon]|nr:hypothetical protein [Candidatus Bilamarchaeaceae archaeon]